MGLDCISFLAENLPYSQIFGIKVRPKKRRQCLHPISKHDASFVDIIHTSVLGMNSSVGHLDFFPNGGNEMPSCAKKLRLKRDMCNHSMATKYWVESITDQSEFLAYHCDSYEDFLENCDKTEIKNQNRMGYHSIPLPSKNQTNYYLDTRMFDKLLYLRAKFLSKFT